MSTLFLRALAGGVGQGTCGLVAYHASWILSPGRIHVLKIIITENKAESILYKKYNFTENCSRLCQHSLETLFWESYCQYIVLEVMPSSNFCDPSSFQRLQDSWPYCGRFTRDDQNEKDDEWMCMFCVNKGTRKMHYTYQKQKQTRTGRHWV